MKTVGIITASIESVLRKEKRGSLKKSEIQKAIIAGINNFFGKQLMMYRATGALPDALRPFVKSANVTIASNVGNLPDDFSTGITFYISNGNSNPAEFMMRDEFEERKNSVILPATELDPIGTFELKTIIVRPSNLTTISLSYIKRPQDITIGTVLSGDSRELSYDEATTTDTEFAPEYAPDLVKEALMFLGVPQQDDGALALAETTKI